MNDKLAPKMFLSWAKMEMKMGQVPRAIEALKSFLKSNPTHFSVFQVFYCIYLFI